MKNDEAILELRDLISDNNTDRENEALLHAIDTIRYINEKVKAADDVIKAFKRPHGKWITFLADNTTIQCSECTAFIHRSRNDVFMDEVGDLNFCPNCGADMRGNEDE